MIGNDFGFTAEFHFRKLNEGPNLQRIKYDVHAPELTRCQAMRFIVFLYAKISFCQRLGTKVTKSLFTYIPIPRRPNLPHPKIRGKHDPLHKISVIVKSKIQLHIESFNPAVTHYRRAHAPLRRYLPPELTIRLMFSDFKETNPEVQCSERTYSRFIQQMNISFCKLGEEECEECREFSLHSHNEEHTVEANGRPVYSPPEELISIVDSWAEDLLKDSDISLDSSGKFMPLVPKFLDRNTDTTCRKISLTILFTSPTTWKR